MFRTSCLLCNSSNLVRIVDLSMHPFADTFIPKSRLSESEPVYPLSCDLCKSCGHVQTSCVTDPKERYALYDYSYTSSNSHFARNHWIEYAREISQTLKLPSNSFIIEVGSNDGFLAEQFKKLGYHVLGVDPSLLMSQLAKKRSVETMVDLFNSKTAATIKKKFGTAQLIVANNVFNHSDAPQDFMKAVAMLLAPKGTFVFESPYWMQTVETKKFDQIYHEHVSYFTVRSAKKAFEIAGLKISNVQLVNYHGGSLRAFAKHGQEVRKVSPAAREFMARETSAKLFDLKTYDRFMKDILRQRNAFLKKIYDIKSRGKAIVAVGAPAKGNTFLNFYNLTHTIIDYVTDTSPQKDGKYTPLTRIPIKKDNVFANYEEVYALVLSWNLSRELKANLRKINRNIKFISP